MKTAKVNYRGIERNMSSQTVQNGGLGELINFRHYNGRLTPSGNPTKVYNLPEGTFTAIWHHDQDGINNYIGLEKVTNNLKLINLGTGASTLIKNYASSVQVEFLKRFMIVIHDSGMDVFLFNKGVYSLTTMPGRPMLHFSKNDAVGVTFHAGVLTVGKLVTTDKAVGTEAILGKYYKALNDYNKEEGLLTGGIMLRAAFRMYDGSYVMHSIPEYLKLGLIMYMYEWAVDGGGQENDLNAVEFLMNKINVSFDSALFADIDKNIFTDIVIFACKNEELFEFNEDTFDDDVLMEKVHNVGAHHNFWVHFSDIFEVSEDFKNMADSPSWYKVHEISIEEIQNGEAETTQEIDTKGFYQDYATRETLPVDQFSHHQLNGSYSYNYISRLIVSDINTIFGDYKYFPLNPATPESDTTLFPDGYVNNGQLDCKLVITLNTFSGDATKVIDAGQRPVADYGGKTWICITKSVIGYPDARAKSIDVLIKKNTNWYKIKTLALSKSKYGNYSFYHSEFNSDAYQFNKFSNDFEFNYNCIIIGSDLPASQVVNINDYNSTNFYDENVLRISEVNNPFVFPAENAYEVGTGRIIAVATNTEPISSGQYGEHPLIVFTTKGRWALFQGSNDILFKSVKPLDGDVPGEATSITSVSTGVVYTTSEGLYMAYGKDVTELSTNLYGRPNIDLQNHTSFTGRLNHNQLVQIVDSLSTVDAKVYIQGALIGFNKIFKELLVTNSDYKYSYIYSFGSKTWRKISQSYDLLIDSYPKLLCVRSNSADNGVFDLSQENFVNDVQGLIVTRPIRFSDDMGLAQVYEAVQRCEIETTAACYAGFYCFGSNDLQTWQLLGGNDRNTGRIDGIKRGRTHLPVQYLVFVFASTMKEYSAVNGLSIAYKLKLDKRLRV